MVKRLHNWADFGRWSQAGNCTCRYLGCRLCDDCSNISGFLFVGNVNVFILLYCRGRIVVVGGFFFGGGGEWVVG